MQIGCKPFFHTVEESAVSGRAGGPALLPPFVAFGSSVRHNDSATFARAAAAKLMHYSRGGGPAGSPWGPPHLHPPAEWLHFTLRMRSPRKTVSPKYASESEGTYNNQMSLLLASAFCTSPPSVSQRNAVISGLNLPESDPKPVRGR